MNRVIRHIRSNAVAYLALFVALGGTSYAALKLPANSVGSRQIRNHSIDPVKLNPKYIAGSVRAWASVNGQGRIVASSGGAKIVASVGVDRITWAHAKLTQRCSAVASVKNPTGAGNLTSPAFADASVIAFRQGFAAVVSVYSITSGEATPDRQPYTVMLTCPLPQR